VHKAERKLNRTWRHRISGREIRAVRCRRRCENSSEISPDTYEKETRSVLWHAVPDSIEHGIPNLVALVAQLLCCVGRHIAPVHRQHAWHVLHDKRPGLPLADGVDEYLVQLVAWVTGETLVVQAVEFGPPDESKALTGRATDDDIRRGITGQDV